MDDSVVNRDVDVSRQLSEQGSAASEEEIDYDVYYGDLSSFIMANFPPVPIINMADYEVDSDEEDEQYNSVEITNWWTTCPLALRFIH